ncbi:GD21408 [Drosophila simulans]|uniref:GD21408 n=1 Tax=Drosophila simulans TaxID=7240 RepID=B4QZF8_DROSI|nr:GD21408 [Drosophila simulans]
MSSAIFAKIVQLGAALLVLFVAWASAQDPDVARTCTAYKKSVWEETSEFSFLIENAPIIYKTLDKCTSYAPLIIGGGPALPRSSRMLCAWDIKTTRAMWNGSAAEHLSATDMCSPQRIATTHHTCLVNKDSFWEDISGFSFPIEAGPIYQTLDRCLSNSPHIIDGEPALPREFPHAARLGHRNYKGQVEWFCGGTLISDRHVLTAAHCHYSPQ